MSSSTTRVQYLAAAPALPMTSFLFLLDSSTSLSFSGSLSSSCSLQKKKLTWIRWNVITSLLVLCFSENSKKSNKIPVSSHPKKLQDICVLHVFVFIEQLNNLVVQSIVIFIMLYAAKEISLNSPITNIHSFCFSENCKNSNEIFGNGHPKKLQDICVHHVHLNSSFC